MAFVFAIGVPTYWSRWRAGHAGRRTRLALIDGWRDARTRRHLSHRWDDWREEIPWMSLYFTFGVWTSISLVFAALTLASRSPASP